MSERRLCTRGDIITRADLASWPACRAGTSRNDEDELVVVSHGGDAEIIEVRRPIAAARRAALHVEGSGGRGLDDAAVIEHAIEHAIERAERRPAQPRR